MEIKERKVELSKNYSDTMHSACVYTLQLHGCPHCSYLNKDDLIVIKKRQYWMTLQEISLQPWNNCTIYPHVSKQGESNNPPLRVGNWNFLMKERDQECLRYSHNSQLIRYATECLIPWHLTTWRPRVVSSIYLGLLIFLLAILIPACASSSPGFLMMYSAF